MKTKNLLFVLSALIFLQPVGAAFVYVDGGASGNDNGSSWSDAFRNLRSALAAASSGDEIWVAAGTYYPDEGGTAVDDARNSTFTLVNGVALYGGFSGSETLLSEREWEGNETILSGDLNQNDEPGFINNGGQRLSCVSRALQRPQQHDSGWLHHRGRLCRWCLSQ